MTPSGSRFTSAASPPETHTSVEPSYVVASPKRCSAAKRAQVPMGFGSESAMLRGSRVCRKFRASELDFVEATRMYG